MKFSTKTDKKGFGFEYDVSAMFQNQGYLARRGVPLHYGVTNHDATDIDVLGVMFTSPFQGHRIICDCKNKVKAKPYERIFWAKGLGEFVRASNVYVALNKTQWEIVRFASSGGVKVLTSDILDEYTKGKPRLGLTDENFYAPYEVDIQKAAKSNGYLCNMLSNTKKLYLHDNPYVATNITMEYLMDIAKGLDFSEQHSKEHRAALRYLACELTVILGLQILWICTDVLGLPEKARRDHITSKLTFGELEPRLVINILRAARDLANEHIKASVPKSFAPSAVDFGEITPPAYTDSIIGLVERALARPELYLNMPQHLDFLLFEQGLKGRVYSEDDLKMVFGYSLDHPKFKAGRNVLAFVRDYGGIDWKTLWKQHEESLLSVKVSGTVIETKAPQPVNLAKTKAEESVIQNSNDKVETLEMPIEVTKKDVKKKLQTDTLPEGEKPN